MKSIKKKSIKKQKKSLKIKGNKVKENKVKENKVKENKTEIKTSLKEELQKQKDIKTQKEIKKLQNIDYFDKYGYDIYNQDERRKDALGHLVIVYGVSDLIKKLDGVSKEHPNLTNKVNKDKKWIKDSFKK